MLYGEGAGGPAFDVDDYTLDGNVDLGVGVVCCDGSDAYVVSYVELGGDSLGYSGECEFYGWAGGLVGVL